MAGQKVTFNGMGVPKGSAFSAVTAKNTPPAYPRYRGNLMPAGDTTCSPEKRQSS
jgi:hypothetical protein